MLAGRTIEHFQGVSFQVAEAATLLDASRAMVWSTSLAVDRAAPPRQVRRLVSETKKFVTEACQRVVHNAMQVMGSIGYTNVYPVERIHRDLRLASIWTGTNEVMSQIVATEWAKERAATKASAVLRDCEEDAAEAHAVEEKVYQ